MAKIAVFFADGFEEIEALTVVDICRRAGIETDMISIMESESVVGGHGITVDADLLFGDANLDSYDMLVLPGGLKGTQNLEAHLGLMAKIDAFYASKKYIAAICAAPSIFGHRGILKGRKACSYPGFDSHLEGADISTDSVCISEHVITSRGMGTAMDFALAITGILCGQEKAKEIADSVVYQHFA